MQDTRHCIGTLLSNTVAASAELEILIVDNASPDETSSLGTLDPRVRVLRQTSNLGFAGGVNAGLRAATGSHLLVINNDTLAAPNMLARMLQALESDPSIALVGPTSNYVKGPARIPVGSELGLTEHGRKQLEALLTEDDRPLQDVHTLSGLCLLMTRAWFDRVGFFDDRFGHGNWEDDDYCLRARLLGARLVIARQAFLHHHGHRTFQALGLDVDEQIQVRMQQFVAKWRDDPTGCAYLFEAKGDLGQAARSAELGLRQRPAWPDGWRIAGRAAFARGDFDRARGLLGSYLEICPSSPRDRIEFAVAGLRCSNIDSLAARHLREFQDTLQTCWFTQTTTVDALLALADAWLDRDQPQRAAPFLSDAAALAPQDPRVVERNQRIREGCPHSHDEREPQDVVDRYIEAGTSH